jgi:hypothetical protein
MRKALAARHIGQVIHAYRHHPYHGHHAISQSIIAGWLSMDQTQISRREKGTASQDLQLLSAVARVLRIPHHLLWFMPQEQEQLQSEPRAEVKGRADGAEDSGGAQESPEPPPMLPVTPPSHTETPSPEESTDAIAGTVECSINPDPQGEEMRRRATLQMIAALSAGAAIPPGSLETVLSGIEDALGNPLDISEWERVVYEYGERILVQPAGSLTHELSSDVIAVGELLKRQSGEPVRADLFRVAAGLSGLLAIDLNDVGDQRAARVSWATAKRAADASRDRDLQVWVRAKEAQKSCWAERPKDIVARLSAEAIQIAGEVPSSGLARAYAALAYVAAEGGNAAGVNSAMSSFRRTFESLPATMTTSYSQTSGTLHEGLVFWSEAYVHTVLGDNQADTAISQALALSPGSAVNEELELFRALVMVRDREIDTGLEHAINTIDARPLGAFRRRVVRQIISAVPVQAKALPAAQELQKLTIRTD